VLTKLDNMVPVDKAREFLWVFGWRVIEQRLPRQAYIVIADLQKLDLDICERLEDDFSDDPEGLKQLLRAGPDKVSRLPPKPRRWRSVPRTIAK
jgi:hypothetical protein